MTSNESIIAWTSLTLSCFPHTDMWVSKPERCQDGDTQPRCSSNSSPRNPKHQLNHRKRSFGVCDDITTFTFYSMAWSFCLDDRDHFDTTRLRAGPFGGRDRWLHGMI